MILAALVAVPLAAGILSAVMRQRAMMETINLAAFAVTLAAALATASLVLRDGSISLWGGFFYADSLSALVIVLTAAVALLCSAYGVGYLREEARCEQLGSTGTPDESLFRGRKFYALTPLLVFSMMLVAIANNIGLMWMAVELTTLAAVFLVTFYGKATSLDAAWKYAMIGGIGLSMALLGTILTYYAAHTHPGPGAVVGWNWSVLARHAAQLDPTAMRLAFVLLLLGYGAKAGIAPMHTWKPDVYVAAPVPSAAVLATAGLNCAIYTLIRFYVIASRSVSPVYPGRLILLLGIFSMILPVPMVLRQKNLRRLLAYSNINHAGVMLTALGIGSTAAATGLLLHMTFYTALKSMLFLCAGNVYQRFGTDALDKIKGGVIRVMPLTGVLLMAGVMAIAGLPPFGLFQSEYLVVGAALASGHFAAGLVLVLSGVGMFAGLARHANRLVLGPGPETRRDWNSWQDGSLLVIAAVVIIIGFWVPGPLMQLIRAAAPIVSGN